MNYLMKKMGRDIAKMIRQFIAIFMMTFIGILIYSGMEGTWYGMDKRLQSYYEQTNMSDAWVYGKVISEDEQAQIKNIKGIKNISSKMLFQSQLESEKDDDNYAIEITVGEKDSLSSNLLMDGKKIDEETEGIWLDKDFADAHNLTTSDEVKLSVGKNIVNVKINGLIYNPEYVYYVKSRDEVVPNHNEYGYAYMNKKFAEKCLGKVICNKLCIQYDANSIDKEIEQEVKQILGDNFITYLDKSEISSIQAPEEKISQVQKLSIIFSTIFLLLAVLTIITTMKRIVVKQKMLVGTFKAIGMKKLVIVIHYSMYGLFVCLFGGLLGCVIGPKLLSPVLIKAQLTTYSIPDVVSEVTCIPLVLSIVVAVIAVVSTVLSCMTELRGLPAENLRTNVPNGGSHNILEKVPLIWNKLSFEWMWIIRGISKNRIRFFMGIVGVIGCMMLIMGSLGLQDSANYANEYLYGTVFDYDYKVLVNKEVPIKDLQDNKQIQLIQENSMKILFDKEEYTGTLLTVDNGEFVHLQDINGSNVNLNKDMVLVSNRVSKELGIHKGDLIEVLPEGKSEYIEMKVTAITNIPSPQGIIISKEEYEDKIGEFTPSYFFTNNSTYKELENEAYIEDVVTRSEQQESVRNLMDSFKMIFRLLIIAAITLGVVILYNLGTLSYTEKAREYATLKVLGMRQSEIILLALRENLLTTFIGIIIAIPIGYAFINLYVKIVSVDSFEWMSKLNVNHFIISIVITFVASVGVALILMKKIKKIDMVESLKASE